MHIEDAADAYVTRDRILSLLSRAEIARVSTSETATSLAQGEEYLDLEQLHLGVRRAALTKNVSTASLLRKSAVHDATWTAIVAELAAPHRHGH